MTVSSYLPQDRFQAIARHTSLPEQTTGTALFADISGFTPLTEALRASLGARQGAEALTKRLGAVFSGLIAEVEHFGGSVISFAGDAITCWFDDEGENSALRAAACALALQKVMEEFSELGLKVSVATGAARRLVAGDPGVQFFDVLAGETLVRMAAGEDLCQTGEALVDEATAQAVGAAVTIREWRVDMGTKNRFAVLEESKAPEKAIAPKAKIENLNAAMLREWLPAWIYERESAGQAAFLNEFRAVTFAFVRFSGIDYDGELAQTQLDEYIRWVQGVVQQFDGYLRTPIIGDKGSYLLVAFGAPVAHEDDTRRALRAALTLRTPPAKCDFISATKIGIAAGVVWVGLYGGETRKSYDFIGDDVNLAARLMQAAAPHEILVSGRVQAKLADSFVFDTERMLKVKGKRGEVPAFAVLEERKRRGIRIQEPAYYLPMVGREAELQTIDARLDLTVHGQSQVIGIVAAAGLGKSRLAAEAIRSAQRKGFVGYGGACQSDGINTPYLAWKSVWQAFFELDPKAALDDQIQTLKEKIARYAPNRASAIPLLGVVLDLNIPDNDFTQHLEPKTRQSALHALFEDCLKSAAGESPLLIVVEDLHWIDALSHDLLAQLAKTLAKYRVCFLLAYRPPELERLQESRLEALAQFTRIELHELGHAESEQILRAKLAQFFGESAAISSAFEEKLLERAQGNPFYLEELLNFLHDSGIDPRDLESLESIELPDSLHSLILSRIDRLLEREKITLKVASIIGRLFKADWLNGYYPDLGDAEQVKGNLSELAQLDITPLDTPEPELAYLFKHIITHEVTYESLPYAMRAKLHEQLAAYLEATYPDALLETLAFHYEQGNNTAKKIEYLRKAGEAAQKSFANVAALEYYGKLLPLLTDEKEQAQIHLKRGEVLQVLGKLNEAESAYLAARDNAKNDLTLESNAQFALGKLCYWRGDYEPALKWLEQAQQGRMRLNDEIGLAQTHIVVGNVFAIQGDYAQARDLFNKSLKLMQQAGNKAIMAHALNNLGWVAQHRGDYTEARALYEVGLRLRREVGDKQGVSVSLFNLGDLAQLQGDYVESRSLFEENLAFNQEAGRKIGLAATLEYLGIVAQAQGEYAKAQALYEESLTLKREIGDKVGIATSISDLGHVAFAQGDYAKALTLQEESLMLRRERGNKYYIAVTLLRLGNVALAQSDYDVAQAFFDEALALSNVMDEISIKADVLLALGVIRLAKNEPEACTRIMDSLRLHRKMNTKHKQTSCLIGMAGVRLQEGYPQYSAQLLGAVDFALRALNATMEPELKFTHARTLAKVKEELGETAFQSAWDEGAKWSLEEAVKKTLEDA